MDAKQIRTLSEAYLSVYDNELDEMAYKKLPVEESTEKTQKSPRKKTQKSPRNAKRTRKRAQERTDRRHRIEYYGKEAVGYGTGEHLTPTGAQERKGEEARSRFSRSRDREAVGFGTGEHLRPTQKEQADLYDIILSHLLDEGYAETSQEAEKIMSHMSEEWIETIVEETDEEREKRLADRIKRVRELEASGRTMTSSRRTSERARQRREERRAAELERQANAVLSTTQGSARRSEKPMGSTPPPEKERAPESNRRLSPKTKSDTLASRADEVLRSMRKEDFNIYDILISHLLDEGYADDVRDAYVILENLNEDEVCEILEAKWGKQPLPDKK